MRKLKEYSLIILIGLLVLGSLFYWYEIKPMKIRKLCWDRAYEQTVANNGGRDYIFDTFRKCHWERGLEDPIKGGIDVN
jgi:hypothetical protein